MGNSSYNSHADVSIALERQQYHAGEVVAGYVQVNVRSSMTCTDLFACFHGDVRTTVAYRTTHKEGSGEHERTVTRHHTAHGRERIVEDRRLVARFARGRAEPGLYQFPFRFALHASLVSSAYVCGGQNHAGVVYGVEVELVRPGLFKPDLVHRAVIDVVSHVPHPIIPAWTIDTQQVNFCCCFNRGHMVLSSALERNAFRASDAVTVQTQLQNNSSSEVQYVAIELNERIYFRAQGHSHSQHHTLAGFRLPAVRPGGGYGEAMGTAPMVAQLLLPLSFQHCTLHTQILEIEHWVEVRADTACCIDNPKVRLPVTLHRSGLAAYTQPPQVHSDESMPLQMAVPYHPNPAAMGSPMQVPMEVGPAVVPTAAQAMQLAPQQQPLQATGREVYQGSPHMAGGAAMAVPMQLPLMQEHPAATAPPAMPVVMATPIAQGHFTQPAAGMPSAPPPAF